MVEMTGFCVFVDDIPNSLQKKIRIVISESGKNFSLIEYKPPISK